ncbi:hypothetical protein HDV02_004871 [Globomyces sp. JEL0801]|nr:hypothetical protein HDV02_004871 [Globomyces sp. JEL0801]
MSESYSVETPMESKRTSNDSTDTRASALQGDIVHDIAIPPIPPLSIFVDNLTKSFEQLSPISPSPTALKFNAIRLKDDYGFFIDTPDASPHVELTKKQKKDLLKREVEWKYIIDNWSICSVKKKSKIKKLCRAGIPDSYRSQAWFLLAGADKKKLPGKFDDTFWMLVVLLETYVPDYHSQTLYQLRVDAAAFEVCLKVSYVQEVPCLTYMTQWFLTLYTMALPWGNESAKVLFRAGLAMLSARKSNIKRVNLLDYIIKECPGIGDMVGYLLGLPKEFTDADIFIEECLKIKLGHKDLDKMRERVKTAHSSLEEEGLVRKKTALGLSGEVKYFIRDFFFLKMSLVPVFATAFGIQAVGFSIAAALQTEKFYDLAGSSTYVACVGVSLLYGRTHLLKSSASWLSFVTNHLHPRQILIAGTTLLWCTRLGSYLAYRIHKDGRDTRFEKIKTNPVRFGVAWFLQGLWVSLTAYPAFKLLVTPASALAPWGILDSIGLLLWSVGFAFEVVADWQKLSWQNRIGKEARKTSFIDEGLWSLSRHPNYFGETTLWIGNALTCASAFTGSGPTGTAVALSFALSPLFVGGLLQNVSGVNLLEKSSDKRFGHLEAYQKYKRNTPVFFPRLPNFGKPKSD